MTVLDEQPPRVKTEWRIKGGGFSGPPFWLGLFTVAAFALIGGFYFGREHPPARGVEWLSDLTILGGGGNRRYFFSAEVKCPDGKSLGIVAVDLNLKNGRLAIVRNDPGEHPVCTAGAPPPPKQQTPPPADPAPKAKK